MSADYSFLTLRNLSAYQPDGARVPPNYVLITSTNGAAVFKSTITINSINVSSLKPSTIIDNNGSGGSSGQVLSAGPGNGLLWVTGGGALPSGVNFSDYLFWSTNVGWTVEDNKVHIGNNAGLTNQGLNAIALGYNAGIANQSTNAIALGYFTGVLNQGDNAIAIGSLAGNNGQGTSAIAIGGSSNLGAGQLSQAINAIAIGLGAGARYQSTNAVSIGTYDLNAPFGQDNQGQAAISIGNNAGLTNQSTNAIAIGKSAGFTTQGQDAIAIGLGAGQLNQSILATAIGSSAGLTNQAPYAIAIGPQAGFSTQQSDAIAIGNSSGRVAQHDSAIAIGRGAGDTNQQSRAIAIGYSAGALNQGENAIGIGNFAGGNNQDDYTIVLNASNFVVSTQYSQSLYINPIRSEPTNIGNVLQYNTLTSEITYTTIGTGSGIVDSVVPGSNITVNSTISPANPIVSLNSTIEVSTLTTSTISSLTILDSTGAPGIIGQILKSIGGGQFNWATDVGGGVVDAVVPGSNITVNSTSTAYPIVNLNSTITISTLTTSTISSLAILDKNGVSGGGGQVLTADGSGNFAWVTSGSSLPTGYASYDYLTYNGTNWTSGLGMVGTTFGPIRFGVKNVSAFPQNDIIAIGNYAGNDGAQGINAIAIGSNAGAQFQSTNAIAIGYYAGVSSQGSGAICIGTQIDPVSGFVGYQSTNAIAIGTEAAASNNTIAQYDGAIAIGYGAGGDNSGGFQSTNTVAIGTNAGRQGQDTYSIAIGNEAGGGGGGGGGSPQGINSIAIGNNAGRNTNLGANSIAIGAFAGLGASGVESTIVINASGQPFQPITFAGGFFIKPLRGQVFGSPQSVLSYNSVSGEITYDFSGTKTFVINHPNDSERYLVHACLEGPEDGIYYRGKGEITSYSTSTIISLPDYVDALGSDFTVQITPIYNGTINHYAASEVENGSFTVYGPVGKFCWLVHGKRSTFNIEPLKSSVTMMGQGPYRWLQHN